MVDVESRRRDEDSRLSRKEEFEEVCGVQVGWFVVCGSCRSFSRKARLRQSHGNKRALEVRS
jgi:hypothetical protein